jgi:hypothetical protein
LQLVLGLWFSFLFLERLDRLSAKFGYAIAKSSEPFVDAWLNHFPTFKIRNVFSPMPDDSLLRRTNINFPSFRESS